MSELSDFLRSALPRGWSGREVERKAEARGHKLSAATVNNYLGGRHGLPDDDTIAAFASVLLVSERAIRAAAGVSAVGTPWEPPESARYLTPEQRRALSLLISSMTERREDLGNDERSAFTNQAGSSGTITDLIGRQAGVAEQTGRAARRGRVPANPLEHAGEEHQGEAPDEGG